MQVSCGARLDITDRQQLLVIASIHQPSTKTFQLFDKVALLSQGCTCFFGKTSEMQNFFEACQLPVPVYSNPAEHALDLINTDFRDQAHSDGAVATVDHIKSEWACSAYHADLDLALLECQGGPSVVSDARRLAAWRSILHTTMVLVHRGFLKSVRDVVAYWIRFIMYTGQSLSVDD